MRRDADFLLPLLSDALALLLVALMVTLGMLLAWLAI
jgi:hypothetical protein